DASSLRHLLPPWSPTLFPYTTLFRSKQYVRETTHATDKKGRTLLFTEAEMERLAGKSKHQSLFDLSDIADGHFFEQAEARVVERSEEHTSELQSRENLVCRLLLEKKK